MSFELVFITGASQEPSFHWLGSSDKESTAFTETNSSSVGPEDLVEMTFSETTDLTPRWSIIYEKCYSEIVKGKYDHFIAKLDAHGEVNKICTE